jgi:hypothetical protein
VEFPVSWLFDDQSPPRTFKVASKRSKLSEVMLSTQTNNYEGGDRKGASK